MINVEICSGTQCMMNGASYMYELLEDLIEEQKKKGKDVQVELAFTKCMRYCKSDKTLTPVVRINDEIITKASTQEVMEKIMSLMD